MVLTPTFLGGSQVMPMLLGWRPHFESFWLIESPGDIDLKPERTMKSIMEKRRGGGREDREG